MPSHGSQTLVAPALIALALFLFYQFALTPSWSFVRHYGQYLPVQALLAKTLSYVRVVANAIRHSAAWQHLQQRIRERHARHSSTHSTATTNTNNTSSNDHININIISNTSNTSNPSNTSNTRNTSVLGLSRQGPTVQADEGEELQSVFVPYWRRNRNGHQSARMVDPITNQELEAGLFSDSDDNPPNSRPPNARPR